MFRSSWTLKANLHANRPGSIPIIKTILSATLSPDGVPMFVMPAYKHELIGEKNHVHSDKFETVLVLGATGGVRECGLQQQG